MIRSCRKDAVYAPTAFPYVQCLLGWLNYLMQLRWNDDGTVRLFHTEYCALVSSFPPLPHDEPCKANMPIFESSEEAMVYILDVVMNDMTYRSMDMDRIKSAKFRMLACYHLSFGVASADDRALWDVQAIGTIKTV